MRHLFIDFVNSELYDGRGNLDDRLSDPAWQRELQAAWDLPELSDVADLAELRAALRVAIERIETGRRSPAQALAKIDAALASAPLRYRLTAGGAEVVPLANSAAGAIALSFARFLADGELDRLKTCDNGGCRWVFHDDTRNRTRRWCGPCGNVDKVRRFRERQRATRGA